MKLLFVTQNIAPFRMDWLSELSKEIDIEVLHLNEYDETCNKKFLENMKKNIVIRDVSKTLFRKKIFDYKVIANSTYDVLMLDGYGFVGQIILIMYLKFKKKKFLMTIDGGIVPQKENAIKKFLKKYCLGAPTAFFSTSDETDQFIKHYVGEKKKIYRHLFSSVRSTDIITYEKRQSQREFLRDKYQFNDKRVVLCVGRFIELKRFDIVLKAAELVDDRYLFIFIGGKPGSDYMALVNEKNESKIKFIDFIYFNELQQYYLAADVFCHPTQSDVWGLVIGEAMSMGLPIISSKNCMAALAMVKPENGIIVEEQNPEAYIIALEKLFGDCNMIKAMQQNNIDLMHEYAIDVAAKKDIENIKDFVYQKG